MGLGGAQQLVVHLLEARGNDIEPTVISLRDSILEDLHLRLIACGAYFHTLSLSKKNPFGLLHVRDAIRRGRFDVLHAHLDFSTSLGIGAALSLGRNRPRIVSNFYADPMKLNSPFYRAAVRAIAPYVDAHIAPGPAVGKIMSQLLGSKAGRTEVVPLGLNLSDLNDTKGDAKRVQLLRGDAKRVVGFMGRLVKQKDVEVLIRAAPALLEAEPSTRLLIVGDGPLRSELEHECRRMGIDGAVKFTGYLSDVVNAYSAIDVLAFVTKYEGLPLTVVEAMAMGVPVVASDVIGVADIIRHKENGLLVAKGDPAALSSNILLLFDKPELAKTLRDTAYKTAHERYSRDRMARDIEVLYSELAST